MYSEGHVFSRRESKERTTRFQQHLQGIEAFQADMKKRRDTDVKKVNF